MGMSFTEFLITESIGDFKKQPILKNNLSSLLTTYLKLAADEKVDLTELDLIESIQTFKDVVADHLDQFESDEDGSATNEAEVWKSVENKTKDNIRQYLQKAAKREGGDVPPFITSLVNKFQRQIVKPIITDLKTMQPADLKDNIKTKDRSKDADDIFGWMLQQVQQLDVRKSTPKEKTEVKKNLKRYNDETRRSKRKGTLDRKKRVKRATKTK